MESSTGCSCLHNVEFKRYFKTSISPIIVSRHSTNSAYCDSTNLPLLQEYYRCLLDLCYMFRRRGGSKLPLPIMELVIQIISISSDNVSEC